MCGVMWLCSIFDISDLTSIRLSLRHNGGKFPALACARRWRTPASMRDSSAIARTVEAASQPHYEEQYLELMRQIWTGGSERVDRTGVGTRAMFGATMRFSLAGDAVPLLTTKRVYWKAAAREMLWFLTRSEEHTSELQSH